MRHVTLLIMLACLQYNSSFSQCDDYIVKGSQVFHANDIRTVINTGGDMFWDLDRGRFQVPFNGSETPSAIFAAGVWMGAFDNVGNLKVAAQTYRDHRLNRQEYLPGPLAEFGMPFDSDCSHWDTVWSVMRYQILEHIQDYEDDGVVNKPLRSIFGWPGIGNPFFEEVNGFAMPDLPVAFYPNSYAPFFDKDLNGIYSPENGDYPLPDSLPQNSIPDLITWHVFNDSRTHHNSGGDELEVEVQQTTYAFFCNEESILDATLFIDFSVVNRGFGTLDSMFFGIWMDPDLGCYTDDFIGSTPENNGFFVYNADAQDGTVGFDCDQGISGYLQGPPAFSGSFLNQEMSSLMVYSNGSVGNPPLPTTDPTMPIEFYRLLTGSWKDGAPLCEGGTGYDAGPGCVQTDLAFPGDPNDTESWSMFNSNLPNADRRVVASIEVGLLDLGEHMSFKMAFTLHLDPERNHLENVELMYEELPLLKNIFDSGFVQCKKLTTVCTEDCVWPGDANNDGIANHYDVLDLGLGFGRIGPDRNAPLSWAPHPGDPWNGTVSNSVNSKFADMNGDGSIDYLNDVEILRTHYGLTHGVYQAGFECPVGNEIIVEGGFADVNPSSFHTRTRIILNSEHVNSLYGLAFTVQFDTAYFREAVIITPFSPFNENESVVFTEITPGVIDYAVAGTTGINTSILENKELVWLMFSIKEKDLIPDQHDTVELCIANIRGLLADGTEISMGANRIQFIFLDENLVGISNVSPEDISVYPNPSTGQMHFEVPSDLIGAQYEVRHMSGQLYSSKPITNEVTQLDLPAGVYVLSIRGQERQYVEKVVVLD